MKAIRILLSIAMLIAAGLGAFNVIPLRTAYFTLIILVAITVSIRIIHRIAGNGAPNTIDAAAVKLFATESCREICKAACQIYGASGLQQEADTNRLLRDSEMLTIAEGTSEICKIVISNGVINSRPK